MPYKSFPAKTLLLKPVYQYKPLENIYLTGLCIINFSEKSFDKTHLEYEQLKNFGFFNSQDFGVNFQKENHIQDQNFFRIIL